MSVLSSIGNAFGRSFGHLRRSSTAVISLQYMLPRLQLLCRPFQWSACMCVRKKAEAQGAVHKSMAMLQLPQASKKPSDMLLESGTI